MRDQKQQPYNEKYQKLYLYNPNVLITSQSCLAGEGKFSVNARFFDIAWQDPIAED